MGLIKKLKCNWNQLKESQMWNESVQIVKEETPIVNCPYRELVITWKNKETQDRISMNYYRDIHEVSHNPLVPNNYMKNLKTGEEIKSFNALSKEHAVDGCCFIDELYTKEELEELELRVDELELIKRIPVHRNRR
ncbi:MAG: hypothetical protein KH135_06195 [Firmicutes bacterium]|nr:hypothetical protein [Bacillota bacterium]